MKMLHFAEKTEKYKSTKKNAISWLKNLEHNNSSKIITAATTTSFSHVLKNVVKHCKSERIYSRTPTFQKKLLFASFKAL